MRNSKWGIIAHLRLGSVFIYFFKSNIFFFFVSITSRTNPFYQISEMHSFTCFPGELFFGSFSLRRGCCILHRIIRTIMWFLNVKILSSVTGCFFLFFCSFGFSFTVKLIQADFTLMRLLRESLAANKTSNKVHWGKWGLSNKMHL